METLKFKEGVKGFKWNSEEGSIEEIFTHELTDAEVSAFNKFSTSETLFNNPEDVVDSFGLVLGGRIVIEGWGLEEVVEVI